MKIMLIMNPSSEQLEKYFGRGRRRQIGGCRRLGARRMGSDLNESTEFPFGVMRMFWNQMLMLVV